MTGRSRRKIFTLVAGTPDGGRWPMPPSRYTILGLLALTTWILATVPAATGSTDRIILAEDFSAVW